MTEAAVINCDHPIRVATILCGSYFVQCDSCKSTLITIPWISAERLLKGHIIVTRAESPDHEKVIEGPAELLASPIRHILMFNERFSLSGSGSIIDESNLGEIRNNPLEVQREYFRNLVRENPDDETLPFALAQVFRELENHTQANECYDRAIETANRNWNYKLPIFFVASAAPALGLWLLSFAPWIVIMCALIGPAGWVWIRRNRQRWVPMVGFAQRADIAARIDMAAALAAKCPTPKFGSPNA